MVQREVIHKNTVTLDDVEKVKRSLKVGDTIEYEETVSVFTGNIVREKRKKVKGVIWKKHRFLVELEPPLWGGAVRGQTISYNQIALSRRKKNV